MFEQEKQTEFLKLLEPLNQELSKYAMAFTRNREDARDLVSETIYIAYQNFQKLKKPESLKYFMFTCLKRLYIKMFWKRKFFGVFDIEKAEQIKDTGSSAETQLDVQNLYIALEKLPLKQRDAIVLFEINGFTIKEICEVQNSSESAVKSRLKRGREKLKEILTEKNKVENISFYLEYSNKKNGTAYMPATQNNPLIAKVQND